MAKDDLEKFGPPYPELGQSVAKHRRRGLITREYGEAVLAAIRAKQRSELRGAVAPAPMPHCASGTVHNDGADILKAMRDSARARLMNCAGQIRRARSPQKWREMYEEAMSQKRTGLSQEPIVIVIQRKGKCHGNT